MQQITKKLALLEFGVLSKDEILKQSVCEVNNERIYDEITRFPTLGGVNDPRMGTVHWDWICLTCKSEADFCTGHFAHINLAKPVYHCGFLEHLRKILKCVCVSCSKLLVKE